MDVFGLRNRVISEYGSYVRSFITIRLLYVVTTRARDELVVTWVGRPSLLLAEVLA